jgi:hypothetical protein
MDLEKLDGGAESMDQMAWRKEKKHCRMMGGQSLMRMQENKSWIRMLTRMMLRGLRLHCVAYSLAATVSEQ